MDNMDKQIIEDITVCLDDGVTMVGIYKGYADGWESVPYHKLDWHVKNNEYMGEIRYLTLKEIWQQLKCYKKPITVVISSPLHGVIYQCGNYVEEKWVKYGETRGYA